MPLGTEIHVTKKMSSISIAWKPVAKINVETEDRTVVLWNTQVVQDFKIPKEEIMRIFGESSVATDARVQWEI